MTKGVGVMKQELPVVVAVIVLKAMNVDGKLAGIVKILVVGIIILMELV